MGKGDEITLRKKSDVPNDKDKINYHVFKMVVSEFPAYEYFVTGDKVGDCVGMNK